MDKLNTIKDDTWNIEFEDGYWELKDNNWELPIISWELPTYDWDVIK